MPEKPLAILYNSCVYELKSKTTEKRWKNAGGRREREGKWSEVVMDGEEDMLRDVRKVI